MLRPGDRVTFGSEVLWRLYRREESLPIFTVLHVNVARKSVLVKDTDGNESALALDLLVPTDTSWDSCRRMLRLAETPEQLIGFMRWHAEGCSPLERTIAQIEGKSREKPKAAESMVVRAMLAAGLLAMSVICPPLGLAALFAAWTHKDA